MKLKDIINQIKKIGKPEKETPAAYKEDPYVMIQHKTRTLGMRSMRKHNNRKDAKGRRVQRVFIDGQMKPIYHSAN